MTCYCYSLKGNSDSDVSFKYFGVLFCKMQRTNDITFHCNIFTVLMQFLYV